MRRKKDVTILTVSIVSGLCAAALLVYYLKTNPSVSDANLKDLTRILVAKKTIEVGEALNTENLGLVNWPNSELPESYFKQTVDLKDMLAASRIPKGMAITKNFIVSREESLANQIPKDHRAMTIDMTGQGGIPDFIERNSYVDVIATINQKGKQPISRTIIQNVKVMRVTRKNAKQRSSSDRITLLLTMGQAERLSLATSKGSIRLALRNQGDLSEIKSEGVDSDDLLWGRQHDIVEKKKVIPNVKLPKRDTIEVIRGVDKKAVLV